MSDYPFFHDATPRSFERARLLRLNVTSAEKELWRHIRKKQLDGLRFRRQHPVDQFILDFYCHEALLAIEVDGPIHQQREQKMYDQEREIIIEGFGIKIIRFKNEDVFTSLPDVLNKIKMEASNRLQLLRSSPPDSYRDGEDLSGVEPALNP
ncbi:MAG TPA: endonuclease domain-containing protein [Cyclobacteriaceae bacterium]|nr:endonuclease domain-containing protein [Cyclobacteriaceae bacterium]